MQKKKKKKQLGILEKTYYSYCFTGNMAGTVGTYRIFLKK